MTAISADVVVLDIEGTTSAAGFILGDLYDYARPRLDEVLGRDDDTVRAARADAIAETGLDADATDADAPPPDTTAEGAPPEEDVPPAPAPGPARSSRLPPAAATAVAPYLRGR